MMDARATVLRVAEGRVWLRLEDRPGGCGRCDEPGGCRSARISHIFKSADDVVCLPDSLGSRVGEGVLIRVPEGAPLRAALLSYVLPLVLMLVMAALFLALQPFSNRDANVLAGVLAGLVVGVAAGRGALRSGRWRQGFGLTLRRGDDSPSSCGKCP